MKRKRSDTRLKVKRLVREEGVGKNGPDWVCGQVEAGAFVLGINSVY
ncbi:MAG: hypothetical protein ABIY47_16580 [Opitutaceae bacterium]